MAILDIDIEDKEDEIRKVEYMDNLNKIICNYEELMPIFNEYLERKKYKRKVLEK